MEGFFVPDTGKEQEEKEMKTGKQETFTYTYSAKEQTEIENIRKKYAAPEGKTKLEQLRSLDAGVTKKAMAAALTVGIFGILVMGFGMSLIMTDLAAWLGLGKNAALAVGVVIGVAGMAAAGAAYPLYNRVIRGEREKIAPQILSLTDELMK